MHMHMHINDIMTCHMYAPHTFLYFASTFVRIREIHLVVLTIILAVYFVIKFEFFQYCKKNV